MTEDGVRVGNALKETMGVEVMTSEALYGHNGNLILEDRASLVGPEAEALLKRVLGGLSPSDKGRLLGELRGHMDEKSTFFLRLDKQEMLLGHLVMAESDAIRIRIRLDGKGEGAEEMIRECLI
jgi:RNA binding exosome subunit